MVKRLGKRDFQAQVRAAEEQDEKLRAATFGLLRQLGRVRVSATSIASLGAQDRIGLSVDPTTGDVTLTYEAEANEEPSAPPRIGKIH